MEQCRIAGYLTRDRALVVANLCDVVAYRPEGPLPDGLGGSEVNMENVAVRVLVGGARRIELRIDSGAQVPAVCQIRNDQLRLEGPPRLAHVIQLERTILGAVRHIDAKT